MLKKRIEFVFKNDNKKLSHSDICDSLSEMLKDIFIKNYYLNEKDNSFDPDWSIKLIKSNKKFILVLVLIEEAVDLYKGMISFEDYNNNILHDEEIISDSYSIISPSFSKIKGVKEMKIVEVIVG